MNKQKTKKTPTTTEPKDNVKSLLINDPKLKALGNELEILIIS